MPVEVRTLAIAGQWLLVAAGCVLLWRHVASPQARAAARPPGLAPWTISPADFLIFVLHVLAGGFIGSVLAGLVPRQWGLNRDHLTIMSTLAAHLGMLAGAVVFALSRRNPDTPGTGSGPGPFRAGLATFLMAMPLVYATGLLWAGVLKLFGVPLDRQAAVELFVRVTSVPWLALFGATAVLLAPITEELLFRWGLFRFLRTRAPRWMVLLLPAALFAAMHYDLPTYAQLVVLGIVFAVAYERTGQIATAMVAHALFNLNMLLALLAGVAD